MSSDAEEGEKEQEAATEEEEGPREMTLEEYKQKHSTVSCYLDTWSVSPVCVCVWGGGEGDWICFRRGTAAMAPLHVGECSS